MKLLLLIVVLILSPNAFAFSLGFICATDNNSADCTTGESQFSIEVSETDEHKALFTFLNSGSNESFISDIYFESNHIFEGSYLIDADDGLGGDSNVDFSFDAHPKNLPGWRNLEYPFQSSFGFSNDPGAANGIQIGESLGILFCLTNNITYKELIDDLYSGEIRIGIHGQGFVGGGSESFISNISTVPIPITFWLFGSGILALFGINHREKIDEYRQPIHATKNRRRYDKEILRYVFI